MRFSSYFVSNQLLIMGSVLQISVTAAWAPFLAVARSTHMRFQATVPSREGDQNMTNHIGFSSLLVLVTFWLMVCLDADQLSILCGKALENNMVTLNLYSCSGCEWFVWLLVWICWCVNGLGQVMLQWRHCRVCLLCLNSVPHCSVLAQWPSHPHPDWAAAVAALRQGSVMLQEQHKLESLHFQGPYLPPVSVTSSIFVPCCCLSLPLPASGPSLLFLCWTSSTSLGLSLAAPSPPVQTPQSEPCAQGHILPRCCWSWEPKAEPSRAVEPGCCCTAALLLGHGSPALLQPF